MSLIQAQVLALMSRDHMQDLAHPTEAEAVQLVRAGLYLLLEIGQRVSMQQVQLTARPPPPGAGATPCLLSSVAPRYWSARGALTSSLAPATSSAAKCTPTCGRSCYPPRCCRTRSHRSRAARHLAQTDAAVLDAAWIKAFVIDGVLGYKRNIARARRPWKRARRAGLAASSQRLTRRSSAERSSDFYTSLVAGPAV